MADELTVSTPEEYTRLTTMKVRTKSGGVFNICAMGASATVYLIGIIPEGGFDNQKELIRFVAEHLAGIEEHVVKPCILAPKVTQIAFLDVVDLLTNLMQLSGFADREDDSFRSPENRADA
jgi:hypothetical protein